MVATVFRVKRLFEPFIEYRQYYRHDEKTGLELYVAHERQLYSHGYVPVENWDLRRPTINVLRQLVREWGEGKLFCARIVATGKLWRQTNAVSFFSEDLPEDADFSRKTYYMLTDLEDRERPHWTFRQCLAKYRPSHDEVPCFEHVSSEEE